MAIITKLVLLMFAGSSVYVGTKFKSALKVPPLPELKDTYWGPGEPKNDDTAIKPFKISISEKVVDDLKNRLENHRELIPPLEGIQQQYGINTNLLLEIIDFWKTKYNWRSREVFLNKYPQFKTKIQGLNIHYIHVKPEQRTGLQVVPLLLLHGWPGSIREFYNVIPLLTKPQKERNYVFEVIVPSLPGYGFSESASKPGLGALQMAVVLKNLMKRIGFEQFYVQGGDWGAVIGSNIATLYPENVLGFHSNMCYLETPISQLKILIGSLYPGLIIEKEFEDRLYPVSNVYLGLMLEMGYFHLQATKPDTLGVGLADSPVGLAAYILEKFTTWTNPSWKTRTDGGLKLKYSYEDLLDNVMIYWVSNSITTSMRLYAETFNLEQMATGVDRIPIKVPCACARFRYELGYQSDFILQEKYPQLVQSNNYDRGGHFIAFEEPQLLADDVWAAVDKFRSLEES